MTCARHLFSHSHNWPKQVTAFSFFSLIFEFFSQYSFKCNHWRLFSGSSSAGSKDEQCTSCWCFANAWIFLAHTKWLVPQSSCVLTAGATNGNARQMTKKAACQRQKMHVHFSSTLHIIWFQSTWRRICIYSNTRILFFTAYPIGWFALRAIGIRIHVFLFVIFLIFSFRDGIIRFVHCIYATLKNDKSCKNVSF